MSNHLSSTSYQVGIVGGGTAGCAAALHLRRRGLSVVLFERRLCGSQASGVNYGGVRQQGRALAELPLSLRARPHWDKLPELIGHDCEFMASGHLKLARSEADMAELEAWCKSAREFGIETQVFGRNSLRAAYPYLGPDIIGGTLCPSDGQANPRLVAPHFAKAAASVGVVIRENCAVIEVRRDSDGFVLMTAANEEISCEFLINTAGAWGKDLAAQFDEVVPEQEQGPNLLVTEPLPYFLQPNLGVVGGDLYIRQIPRGNVIFGGGHGWADMQQIRARPLAENTLEALQRAVQAIPALASAQVIRSWSGIEGFMPDGLPVLGPSRTTPGLIHAFGFSGHGFMLGPGIGELLADLVTEGSVPEPLQPFAVGRFAQ